MNRLHKWQWILAAMLCMGSHQGLTQEFPSRPLRMIIPYTPGGAAELIGRGISNKLAEYMGQPVLVDNRPGANTIIGAEIAAKASPDGHTLLFATTTTMVLNPATYTKLPYDPIKDFAPVAKLSEFTSFIGMRNGFPAKNVGEFIAYAKANPGKVTYGSTGQGSTGHFSGAMLESVTGIKMTHVPYKGNAQANVDLLAERLDLVITGLPSIETLVKAGKMRMLAFAGHSRHRQFPDLATVAESGYPEYWAGAWFSMVTRSGTPRPVVLRLNREINRSLQAPEVRKPLLDAGHELANGTPEDLDKMIRAELPRWAKVAKEAKLSFD